MKRRDFYNVAIYNTKDGKPEGVQLKALTREEILNYFEYVKKGEFGMQPIGSRKENVVSPDSFLIFDFSKTLSLQGKDRPEYRKAIEKMAKESGDFLTACRELGQDITDSFGLKLEEILNPSPENNVQSKSQSVQYKMEAESAEFEISGGSISGQVKGSSSVDGELTGKVSPLFPKEFDAGIVDNSIPPAFRVEKIAAVFASHIKNLKDESGQMIGVFGQWGRGKSYFINEVFKIYGSGESSPFMMIKFQAWKYQNMQSIWAYLYETFIEEYLDVKWRNKWTRIFCLSINRNGHWKTWIWPLIGILIGVFAFSFTSTLTDDNERQLIIKIAGFAATLAISIDKGSSIMKKIKNPATSIFNSFSKAPSFKEVLGVQAEIQKELKNLIKAWSKKFNNKRILLFVDDLDRCSESQIIEIIDSLRVILDDELITKHILILVALDEKKLAKAISKKYENLFSPEELPEIVAEYMDKLFISAIKLFPISFDDRAEFVEKLAKQINLEDNPEEELTKESKPIPTKTPTSVADSIAETGVSPDSGQGTAPISSPSSTPTSATEVQKSSKNLEEVEVTMLQGKIKSVKKELTPRQIRILIYRYLLARNIWLIYFDVIDWKAGDAIDEIMRFSGFTETDAKTETEIFQGLSNIVRMVVAY